jgi:hypothetical protein
MGSDHTPDLTALQRRVRCQADASEPLALSHEDFAVLALAIRDEDDDLTSQAMAILHLAHPSELVRLFAAKGLRRFGIAVSAGRR